MLVTIETASIEHLDWLCEIEVKCFGREAFTRQQIYHLLADPDSVGLVSKLKGEIVGFVIGKIYMDRKTAVGHISTIDVLSEHRRGGIGQMLLQGVEKTFKDKGVTTCFLEARENNTAALSLYQKFGYKRMETLEKYYGDAHGIRLRKALT